MSTQRKPAKIIKTKTKETVATSAEVIPGDTEGLALQLRTKPARSSRARSSLLAMKRRKEIRRRIVLKSQRRTVSAADFATLIHSLCLAARDKDVGFNHATTDLEGWFKSLAPYGVTIDDAFVEDMLYAANLLNEVERFNHPQGKTFDELLSTVLKPKETFDREINTIQSENKCNKKLS